MTPNLDQERVERAAEAVYREFENRPKVARLQMNGVMADELARAAITAYLGGTHVVVLDHFPVNLHPRTADLVKRFAVALAKKLRLAEEKYGFGDGWADDHWEKECLAHFHSHIEKGDPRDVAAYCAFMWHHGWITAPDDKWQSIDTAPHSTRVLLGWRDWRDGSWLMEVGAATTGQRFDNGYSNRSQHGSATHWQPLPQPPATPTVNGKEGWDGV